MNASEPEALKFVDSLDYLLVDCRSGDPNRALNCRINTALGAVTGLILPVFIVSGLVFNGLIVYINLFRQSVWTRQNVYISMIALADNCNIFMNGFMWMFLAKGLPWLSNGTAGYFHLNSSELACQVARYFEGLCYLMSASLFLLMVTDRALSLYFPFKFQVISGKSAMKASLVVLLICVLITIPKAAVYSWVYSDGYVVCYINYDHLQGWANTAYFYYSGMFYYPPTFLLVLILIGNFLLIHKVRMIIKDRKAIRGDTSDDSLTNTAICVTLSAVLLISSLPVVVSCIVEYAMSQINPNVDGQTLVLLWGFDDLGITLIIMNQSINWVFLMWKNHKFRNEFLDIMACRKYQRKRNASSNTESQR